MNLTHVLVSAYRDVKGRLMLCDGYDQVFDLNHGDLIELHDARGTTVRVTQGTLWITQQHDTQDIVLRTGDVWTVERHGLTLVEAQCNARLCVIGANAEALRGKGNNLTLRERLRAW